MKHTSIADVSVISALQPGLVLVVAGPLFGERVSASEVGWAIASLAGVVMVTLGSAGTPIWSLFGDVLAAFSLFAWTAYFLVSKHARATVPTVQYMTVVFVFAALVITPLTIATGQPVGGVHLKDWAFLFVFVLAASGGHLLLAWAHSTVDVTVSSLLMLGQPVVASAAAWMILGERLSPLAIAGGLVVIGSLAAIVRRAALAGEVKELEPPELPQL
ncbi:MAG: DMT family transporter [Actinobacteria bacterium]|nr:DMT family transporter [Actinomycetota bacterium]